MGIVTIFDKYKDQKSANLVKNWVLWYQDLVSKFEANFRCSPEKYFWKSGHPGSTIYFKSPKFSDRQVWANGCIAFVHFLRNSMISFAHHIITIIIINYDKWPWSDGLYRYMWDPDFSLWIINFSYCNFSYCTMTYTHYHNIVFTQKPVLQSVLYFLFHKKHEF